MTKNIIQKEPEIDDSVTINSTKLIRIIEYYKNNTTSKDIKEYIIEYVKNNTNDEEIINILNNTSCKLFNTHIGIKCRLIARGLKVSDKHIVAIEDHINHLLDIYEDNITIEKKERVYTKLDNIIKLLESIILEQYTKKYDEKIIIDYINDNKIKKSECNKLIEYLKNKYISQSITINLVINILRNNSYIITRKHKKKEIDLDKLVSKVKYCKEYEDIISINPKDIVNKKHVLLYDTKYKTIRLLSSDSKLTIRGSTIYDFNIEDSKCKYVKDIKVFLESINTNNVKYISNTIDTINTKPKAINGSLNENVIILKVI